MYTLHKAQINDIIMHVDDKIITLYGGIRCCCDT